MNESDVRGQVARLLRSQWYWDITQTDLVTLFSQRARQLFEELRGSLVATGKNSSELAILSELKGEITKQTRPPKGRPDILCLNPKGGNSIVVEVKVFPSPGEDQVWAQSSFSFSKIDESQRRWLTIYGADADQGMFNGFKHTEGSWLALGTVHGRVDSDDEPRCLWLVPWTSWLAIERQVLQVASQGSLPLAIRPGLKRTIQDNNLCAMHLLSRFRCLWVKGEGWSLAKDHPLYKETPRDLATFSKMWRTH